MDTMDVEKKHSWTPYIHFFILKLMILMDFVLIYIFFFVQKNTKITRILYFIAEHGRKKEEKRKNIIVCNYFPVLFNQISYTYVTVEWFAKTFLFFFLFTIFNSQTTYVFRTFRPMSFFVTLAPETLVTLIKR